MAVFAKIFNPYHKEHSINLLEHLNEEQKEVVMHFEGPLLVLAGAGSGKTRAITFRIAHLVNYYGVDPASIVALTFTNKAAREMLHRLINFPNGKALRAVTTSTFHSFGLIFLKENAAALNISPHFQVIDDDDQQKLLAESLAALNIPKDEFPPKKIRGVIDNWKNQGIELSEFIKEGFYSDFIKDVYKRAIKKYEALKDERGLMDFGDLLLKMLNALNNNPDILKSCQERYKHILVDEYQDTNAIQYKIVKKLCGSRNNITVVGDDDQSIYSFRGAEIRNILDFKHDFPDVKIVTLSKNYRSSRTILDAANAVIRLNRKRMAKNLHATKDAGEKIKLYRLEDEKAEASMVTKKVKELLHEGFAYKDMAIFYRTNVLSRRFEDVLRREKIPYKIFGSIRFYNRREVKDIIALIRFLLNKHDVLGFGRLALYAVPGVGKGTIEKITAKASQRTAIPDAIAGYLNEIGPATKIALALKAFLSLLKKLEESFIASEPADFIDTAIELTAYREHLRKDVKEEKEYEEKLKNIEELKIAVTENKKEGKDYLQFINDIILGDIDREEVTDFVTLMTVHSSKGLEFPIVFITAVEDDIFPHIYSKMENNEEEERRLFYVAVTRAKELLYLSHVRSRNMKYQRVSPFLKDIPGYLIEDGGQEMEQPVFDKQSRSYSYGEPEKPVVGTNKTVFHDFFGKGRILNTLSGGDDPVFLVQFDNGGLKKILGSFLKSL